VTERKPAHVAYIVPHSEEGTRLDLLVRSWLERDLDRPFSKSAVRKLIMAGAIRLDGGPIRQPGALVHRAARLDGRIELSSLDGRGAQDDTGHPIDLVVLYEDEDVIAVGKPAGIVMHGTADPRRRDLFNSVRDFLARRSAGSASACAVPYLGLHHRLDVETSGVVLFTKQERANAALAEQFTRGEVTKIYHAIILRPSHAVPGAWRVENRLAMIGSGQRARMRQAATGARAVTAFTILERLRGALLVEARPATGRKHQIRAHLAGSHGPILGDLRYGGMSRAGHALASRVMLHAWHLSLRHPATGAPLTITCPYPPDFEDLLARLRRA